MQNIQQLVAGDYDIAFSLADTAADAVDGQGRLRRRRRTCPSLGRIYSNYTHVIVQEDSGIDSVDDFKGKRISTGSPKSGTEVIANRLHRGGRPEDRATSRRSASTSPRRSTA